jgi:lambda family phage minor tail protein L
MSQLETEGKITLFQLDTTMLPNGQMFYFQSMSDFDTPIITWGGTDYSPIPMTASGFEITTRGTIPTPTLVLSNLYGAANTLLLEFSGLLGSKFHRIVTLRRFLDDGDTPDPNAFIMRDMFVVAQKLSHNAKSIAFKLMSHMDTEGVMLPRRLVMRDYCQHVYRAYNPVTNTFDYSKATCPYTDETRFFDVFNNPTDRANDMCSHNKNGCKDRFPNQLLPAWFFPGVGRIK